MLSIIWIFLICVSFLPIYPLASMKFRFNNSAHAMLFSGTLNVFLLPYAMHVKKFSLLNSSFMISESWTFIITEPSFKCKFTFLPRKDRAVFTPKPSIVSPLQVFVCQFAPALPADWLSLSSENDVDFNIVVVAFTVPRILTPFHNREPPLPRCNPTRQCFLLLKPARKRH